MKPDWSKAPSWAVYHAVDFDGTGRWFDDEPTYEYGCWYIQVGKCMRNFDFLETDDSLESRP